MSHKVLVFLVFLNILSENVFSTLDIPVGGIFEGLNEEEELAFEVAINKVNRQKQTSHHIYQPLTANIEPETIIDSVQGKIIDTNWDRPFAALESACSLLSTGVIAIFTALSKHSASTVESLCDTMEIPIISISPYKEHSKKCCSINLFPHVPVLGKAFADLIKSQNWESFTILYETEESFVNIAEIFKIYNHTGQNMDLQQLYLNENGDYMDVLKIVRKSKQTNLVLHCETEHLNKILTEAQQVGLMMRRYNYIIVSLDMETIDITRFQHSETNITSMRLIDSSNPKVKKIAKAIQIRRGNLDKHPPNVQTISTCAALMVDAVMIFAKTLRDVGHFNAKPLFCDSAESWEHGSTIFNFIKMNTLDGLTGLVQFDHRGIRSDFSLDVIELRESGVIKTGTWDPNNKLQKIPIKSDIIDDDPTSLRNKHLTVMIAWSEPYASFKNSSTQLTGNDQYEGFCIDLIQEISLLEGFNYTLLRNEDDKNGDYNKATGKWNGMIGDILNGVGDIAIGDIAITKEREQAVDFTVPFMSFGIQILYTRPTKPEPDFLSFAYPFAPEIWLLVAVSYFAVSIGLFLMSRVCQQEWATWNPCIRKSEFVTNQFNLRNSFWFVIGCFMQQGAEIAPRGASTRILSSFFAFFILVIVSFYKAQLAAFLTTERLELSFNNAEELVKRADKLEISYGAVANEATHTFFKMSQTELYKQIGVYMDAHPENMVPDNYEGVLKVQQGNYAFFLESVTIKFIVNAWCSLTGIGERISERYFGIAMKKNAVYRNRLSEAILKLQETGKIDKLERKWREEVPGASLCPEHQPDSVAPPLNLRHVSGMFWITIIGIVFAFGLAFVELAIHVSFECRKTRKSFKKEFLKELRFAFTFKEVIKYMKSDDVRSLESEDDNEDI